MRVKLDENLGTLGIEVFRKYGHDTQSVVSRSMQSATDAELIQMCRRECRCIVTLDLDFSNPFVFPPHEYAGIAVLRLPAQATSKDMLRLSEILAAAMNKRDIAAKLWIVQSSGVREYQPGKMD